MNRREFMTLLGGTAVAWPLAARAQQGERMRRIGVFSGGSASDPEVRPRIAAFVQGLAQLGWTDGRNVRIDYRWGEGNADTIRKTAVELVALAPDVILTPGGPALEWLLQATAHCADRVCDRHRSGRLRLCREPGAAGRQRYRLYAVRIQFVREMAGTAQGDRSGRDAGGGSSGPCYLHRDRPVCRHPIRGSVARFGGRPDQRARRRLRLSAPLRRSRAPAIAA